jgi:hypothetical protein
VPPIPAYDRRRRGVVPRLARLTYPARRATGDFFSGFPCTLIGHYWIEIPQKRRRTPRGELYPIRFHCKRCAVMADFTA